jgi:hypothetical protein
MPRAGRLGGVESLPALGWPFMDEGSPIAYQLLEGGVPVIASDEVEIGTVSSVLAAEEQDIFHGLLVRTDQGVRFVEADVIAALHEHGVDLRIDSAAAAQLPGPEHAAPVYDEDPLRQQAWRHWWHRITLRDDWKPRH